MTAPTPTTEDTKNLAQAALFEAQRDAALAEARLKNAEAEQKEYHTEAAKYGAVQMRIQTDATLRQEKLALNANHLHHEYVFWGGVSDDNVEDCLNELALWHREDETCDMNITMHSPGGSLFAGMHLFDQISAYSKRPWDTRTDLPRGQHNTTVTVRGYAASMGGILLQAADNRIIGPESFLMIHEVSTLFRGKVGDMEDEMEFLKMVSGRVADAFVRRAEYTKGLRSEDPITKEEFFTLWKKTDKWLSSEQAYDYGFADKIG